MAKRLLIVDDDHDVLFALSDYFTLHGYKVVVARNRQSATYVVKYQAPDVAIVDYRLPDGTALDALSEWQTGHRFTVPTIILTGHSTLDLAVRAIKQGAENFLAKPVDLDALRAMVEAISVPESCSSKAPERTNGSTIDPFAGNSKVLSNLADAARKVAHAGRPILIDGETGTGKGVLARWLHHNGPRAHGPFIAVNCASLSPELLESELFGHAQGAFTGAQVAKAGLFEVADGGTLFLDEIGDLDPAVQPKLLKALEEQRLRRLGETRERRVDVQLIAASHQDLRQLVRERRFRSDLYYRIAMLPLTMPALRQRADDLQDLASQFARSYGTSIGRPAINLSDCALKALREYEWPGNVRELRNVIERSVLLSQQDTLDACDIEFLKPTSVPKTGKSATQGRLTLKEIEKDQIDRALREEMGNVARAAKRLGMPRSTLYYKLKKASREAV